MTFFFKQLFLWALVYCTSCVSEPPVDDFDDLESEVKKSLKIEKPTVQEQITIKDKHALEVSHNELAQYFKAQGLRNKIVLVKSSGAKLLNSKPFIIINISKQLEEMNDEDRKLLFTSFEKFWRMRTKANGIKSSSGIIIRGTSGEILFYNLSSRQFY